MRLFPCVLLLACATSPTSDDTAADSAADTADTAADTAADIPYAEMNRDQRLAFMATTVTPQMAASFEGQPLPYGTTFGCESCHGPDMVEKDYAMPNGLFPLDYASFPYSASSDPTEAEWGVFMENEVLPDMAALLGKELYDYTTNPEGFGCFGCHALPEG